MERYQAPRPRASRFFLSALANIAVAVFVAQLAMAASGAELFVSSGNEVKRYDAATGAFLGNFVTAGSGGLSSFVGNGLGFGPDGNLYVASNDKFSGVGNVLRYSGASGAFLGVLLPFLYPGSFCWVRFRSGQ